MIGPPIVFALLLQGTTPWFVSPAGVQSALASSDAITILDARDARAYDRGHVPHAVRVDWKDYRDGWGRTGKLPANSHDIARKLAALGVADGRRVVVYGAAREGWGEEGRIAWMLYYLGHDHVQILDGGYRAWTTAHGPVATVRGPMVRGPFTARPRAGVRAQLDDVARAVGVVRSDGTADALAVVLDVRPRDEWDGARHYFEPRTGHIPGAVRFEWRDLMDSTGHVRPSAELLPLLATRGVRPDRPVIVYCTGGVRSAMAFWILRSAGFTDVRNFDGSWFEWAFDRSKPVVVGGPDRP